MLLLPEHARGRHAVGVGYSIFVFFAGARARAQVMLFLDILRFFSE
jgi:hypothetical protein